MDVPTVIRVTLLSWYNFFSSFFFLHCIITIFLYSKDFEVVHPTFLLIHRLPKKNPEEGFNFKYVLPSFGVIEFVVKPYDYH